MAAGAPAVLWSLFYVLALFGGNQEVEALAGGRACDNPRTKSSASCFSQLGSASSSLHNLSK